jgi:hypothetical protein
MRSQLRLLGAVLLAAGPLSDPNADPVRCRNRAAEGAQPPRMQPRSNRPIGGPACR